MQLPTVKIKHERRGYVIINESDFDESKHQLFVEESEVTEEKPKATRKPRAKKAESENEAAE